MASSYLNSFGFSELLALSRMLSALRDGPQQVVAPPGYVLTSWRDYKANAKPGDVLFLSSSRNFSNWSAPVRPDEVDESFTCLYAKRAEGVDLCAPNSDYATCTANVASYPKDKVKPFDPPVPSGYMSCPVSEISESSNREDYLLLNPFTFRWEAPVFGLLAYVRQGHTKRFAKRCSALQSPASPMVTAPPIPVGYVASTPLEYNLLAQSGDPTFKWWLPGTGGWQLPANPNRGGSRSAKHGFKCIRSTSSMVVGLPMEPAPPLAIPEGYEPCTVEEYRREARKGLRTYLYTRPGKTEWLAPRNPQKSGTPRPGLRTVRLKGRTEFSGESIPAGYVSCTVAEYAHQRVAGSDSYLKTHPALDNWYRSSGRNMTRVDIGQLVNSGFRACKRKVATEAPSSDYPPVPKGFISCTAEFFKANGKRRDASWLRCGRGENWRIPQVNPSCINPKCARINGTQFCYRPALVPPSPSVTAPSAPKTPVTTFGPDGFAVVPEGYVIATRADFIDSSCKPNPPAHLDQSKWQMARVGEPWRPYKKADSTDGSFGFGELHIIRPSAASPLATVPTATLPTPPVRPWTVPPKVGTVLRSRETKVPWIVTAWSQTNGTVQLAYPKSTGGHVSNVLSLEQVCSFLEQADGSPAGDVDPWWNPDNLTAEQLAVGEGFRFVTQSEVDAAKDGRIPDTEWWNAGRGWYVGYAPLGGAKAYEGTRKYTLRTKAPLPGGAK